jgi:hypothetical protein
VLIGTRPCRTGQMAKARSRRTSRVRRCMPLEATLDSLVSDMDLHLFKRVFELNSVPAERNMYLAEDRILCFEIVTKKREGWV